METSEKYNNIRHLMGALNKDLESLNKIIDNKKAFNKSELKKTKTDINICLSSIDDKTKSIQSELYNDSELTKEESLKLNADYSRYCKIIFEKSQKIWDKLDLASKNKGQNLQLQDSFDNQSKSNKDRSSNNNESFSSDKLASSNEILEKKDSIYSNDETMKLIESIQSKLINIDKNTALASQSLYVQSQGISNATANYQLADELKKDTNSAIRRYTTKEYLYTYLLHLIAFGLFIIMLILGYRKIRDEEI